MCGILRYQNDLTSMTQGRASFSMEFEHYDFVPGPQAEKIIAAAKAEIAQEVSRAKEALRNQVADLAVAGASQILKREVDAKAHAEILAALQKQL